ncbi:recombinase family protein [Sabulicella glaciei]|uniref:Recombinase family protein n=1 Tax=Sabulicella glaciei TaxID=2984948 RepID=A0ABT3NZT8_9PROT|nr:recombinase family protein [Roseococcus sp. MDT2-1-1]
MIYARYSSENQREASIEDQVRICRARAGREGWTVGNVFVDAAFSGATALRPGYQALLSTMRAGQADIVLAESLDRLSRDQEHVAALHKQARFAGVRIVTLAEGDISELHIGLKGTMSALFLQDLAQKTHRGLEGRVRAGGSAGGLSYGYRIRCGLRSDGTPVTGELEVVPEEAAIVRRIFRSYADGVSPRAIAKALNAEAVPGARGGRWSASLLLGGAARETGLLRNHLYVGQRIWNRQRFSKDPSTGRRVARLNPREAWITTQVPELAIIDAGLWQAVQDRLRLASSAASPSVGERHGTDRRNTGARLAAARRPAWLLSGLVRCGVCHGPMSVMGSGGRLGCANHVERGTCDNPRTVLRDRLLTRVLVGLKERLLAPDLVEEFVRTYVAETNAANRERGQRQAGLSEKLAKLNRQIRNLVELIKDGHGSAALVGELRTLEQQQATLTAELGAAGTAEPVPVLHPNLPELYRRKVEALEVALQEPNTAAAAATALRGLIDAILIFPGARRGELTVELRGDLAALLDLSSVAPQRKTAAPLVGNGRSGEVLETWDAGKRNRLVLPRGKEKGRPENRTADLIEQVKMVAGACNRLNLLFDAPRLRNQTASSVGRHGMTLPWRHEIAPLWRGREGCRWTRLE